MSFKRSFQIKIIINTHVIVSRVKANFFVEKILVYFFKKTTEELKDLLSVCFLKFQVKDTLSEKYSFFKHKIGLIFY